MEKVKIKFLDYDDSIIDIKIINKGEKLVVSKPKRKFYKFVKWDKKLPKYPDDNMEVKAIYKPIHDKNKNGIPDEEEFYNIINDIINNEEYLKRKEYHHHGETSVYDHCLDVAYYAFRMSKKLNLDYKSATIAGMLHDFYYKDWQKNTEKQPFFKQHGFIHAKEALENSKKNFPDKINKKVENAIVRHMFPLNIHPPKYLESWIVSISDKYVSMDSLRNPKIIASFFSKKYRK